MGYVRRAWVLLVSATVLLAGVPSLPVVEAHAEAGRDTVVRGLTLAPMLQPEMVARDRFGVTGPRHRPVVLQHRSTGERWQKALRAPTSASRAALVRLRVLRSGEQWVWKARLQDKPWTVVASTDQALHEFRVVVPAHGEWGRATSPRQGATVRVDTRPPAAPGTRIRPTHSRQVLVADRDTGTRGTYVRFEWREDEGRWAQVGTSPAVFGYGGVVAGSTRLQGSGTTPAGRYRLLYAFGARDPGAVMRYRRVTDCSHWVLDRDATDYNRWRESCVRPPRDGEHLQTYVDRGLYRQAVVTSFNYDDPRVRQGPGSGGAIFLHYATRSTAGCVGLTSMAELTSTVRWLDPAANPLIVVKR